MESCVLAPPPAPVDTARRSGHPVSPFAPRDEKSAALTPDREVRSPAWRDQVTTRWLQALDRLATLTPRWRTCYEALVAVVSARLQRYDSLDLLITCYFQGSDFAAEAIRARYPTIPHAWDVFLIEDAAWGRRLQEIAHPSAAHATAKRPEAPSATARYAQEGSRCIAAEDWAGARRAFRAATALAPTVAAYWRELGTACAGLADWRWAQDALEHAQRLQPTDETELLLGEIRAIRRLSRQLRDRPSDAALHLRLGTLLMAWEQADPALTHLQRAVALAPAWPMAQFYLGLEYHYRQEWDLAAACYQRARELGAAEARLDPLIAACRAGVLPVEPPDPTGESGGSGLVVTAGRTSTLPGRSRT